MTYHPMLVAETLDQLASYDRTVATSTVSMAVTSSMRRLVNRGVATNAEVMTWNSGGYWEVTGATVAAILAKQPEVTMTGIARKNSHGRNEKHWATTANAERWAKERETKEAAAVEADTRYVMRESLGHLRVVDTDRIGKVATPDDTAVAIFDMDALTPEIARELAQRAKRALVRMAVK